jgi:2-furoyl-CoA dehydrogenase FAD binding subunit
MKSPKFTYACPRSVEEALALLAHGGDEAKILVGGQSLVPLLNLRTAQVSPLVDVNRLSELSFIKRENGALRVGAPTRHRQFEISEDARAYRLLGGLLLRLGIWQFGTAERLVAVWCTPIPQPNGHWLQ